MIGCWKKKIQEGPPTAQSVRDRQQADLAHAHRKLYSARKLSDAELAQQILDKIAALELEIGGLGPHASSSPTASDSTYRGPDVVRDTSFQYTERDRLSILEFLNKLSLENIFLDAIFDYMSLLDLD